MLIQLDPLDYPIVRDLLHNLAEFELIIKAVIAGSSPAWVVVDDAAQPTSVLMCTAEGQFLGGNPENPGFWADLRTLFFRAMNEEGFWQGGSALALFCTPGTWERKFPELFSGRQPVAIPRQHYLCSRLAIPDWRTRLPEGFTIRRIDQALLTQPELDIPDHVTNWMRSNWGTPEAFLQSGFGFCIVHHRAAVSWCLADCAVGDQCEIGIQTQPDYQRRGLATLTAVAAADYALSNGFKSVGWHCNADNLGSIGVALKVGFQKERDYMMYYLPLYEN